ncbi:MAG: amino acid carrier protein [Clostridia bacterium]|nr:amino acid carrier protein [Clostridia bacterium]
MISALSDLLGSVVTPVMLCLAAVILLPHVKPGKILAPRRFFRTLGELGASPFRALSVALAGTLGVGNITGVASALIAGGPGAVFWMWAGAFLVLGVKYAEVNLALRYRLPSGKGWVGGAMYYIRDGIGTKSAAVCGVAFAVLCCLNSLITGNIVQSNAAACVFDGNSRLICGAVLAALTGLAILSGTHRIERITSSLIPPLTLLYIAVTVWILCRNAALLPGIFGDIVVSAFSSRAVSGAAVGFGVREAFRFGIMRGIFSNEAGCGTSPTAHASAETKSPHHQATLGMVEVIFDTLILCTLTALVLLIADRKFGVIPWKCDADAAPVTLDAFRLLGGDTVHTILQISVLLFAFSTIIAQIFYGTSAVMYLSRARLPRILYAALSVLCAFFGSVISSPVMWLLADGIIGIMTAVNCAVLILLRRRIVPPEDG